MLAKSAWKIVKLAQYLISTPPQKFLKHIILKIYAVKRIYNFDQIPGLYKNFRLKRFRHFKYEISSEWCAHVDKRSD